MAVDTTHVAQRISLALYQDEQRRAAWDDMLKMYLNDFGSTEEADGTLVKKLAPNFVRSTIRRLVPQLYFDDPRFYPVATRPEFEDRARVVGSVLDYYWRALKVQRTMRQIITDALVYPFGVVMVGMGQLSYATRPMTSPDDTLRKVQDEHDRMRTGEPVAIGEEDDHDLEAQLHTQYLQSPSALAMPPDHLADLAAHRDAHQQAASRPTSFPTDVGYGTTEDWPFIARCCPRHVFWEPGVLHLNESGYLLYRMAMRVMDVREMFGVEDLEADEMDETLYRYLGGDAQFKDLPSYQSDFGRVWVWQCWDATDKTVSYWAKKGTRSLQEGQDWPYPNIEGYPFRLLTFEDVPDAVHGPGLEHYLTWPQKMLMRLYSRIATHTDQAATKYTVLEQAIGEHETTDTFMDKLKSSIPGEALMVKVHEAVRALDPAPLDQTILNLIPLLQAVVTENSGISDEQRGVARSTTATQASIIGSAGNILAVDNINRVKLFQGDTAQMLLGVLKDYGPDEQLIQIVYPWGTEWAQFLKDDIIPEWQLEVEMATPPDNQAELAMALNFRHEFMGSPFVNQYAVDRYVTRKFGMRPETEFIQPVDPEVQAHIQAEQQLMQMGRPVQPTPGEKHPVHLQAHQQAAQQVQQSMQQMSQAMAQQLMQTNPMFQQRPDILQQAVQQQMAQQPQAMQAQQYLQALTQHIQATQALQGQMSPPGRRRNTAAQAYPAGSPGAGTTHSIISAQQTGG